MSESCALKQYIRDIYSYIQNDKIIFKRFFSTQLSSVFFIRLTGVKSSQANTTFVIFKTIIFMYLWYILKTKTKQQKN